MVHELRKWDGIKELINGYLAGVQGGKYYDQIFIMIVKMVKQLKILTNHLGKQ